MFSFSRLSGCVLSVALTAGLTVDVLASEFTRERAASAMYGKTPAGQRMMRFERAVMPPWFRMSPPPAFNRGPMTHNTAARIAQYRPPMPPPAPMWSRAARQPVALARYQRPVPPPAFNRGPVTNTAARIAQYRPPMPPPAPMWARAPWQPMASPSSPAEAHKLQAQNSASDDMGKASDTAELAAFESSPSETPRLPAQNGESDDVGQTGESAKLEGPVAEVPPLLARPTWMNAVADGS